jgi:probable F420-dependent oxidoreductase
VAGETGKFALTASGEWLEPFITLAYAAAVTSKIRLATGICLVPEHNPLCLAKEIASLDRVANGRFALGVGIGWNAEEFAALGIPWERRGERTSEYIEVMRKLWSPGVASHHGEFVNFDDAGSSPKPPQGAKLPIIWGGESNAALRRTAECGDGWYGFNLDPAGAKERIEKLHQMLKAKGRKASDVELIVAPHLYQATMTKDDIKRYRDLGINEIVVAGDFLANPGAVVPTVEKLAREWVDTAAALDWH